MRFRLNRFEILFGLLAVAMGLALAGSARAAEGEQSWSGSITTPRVELGITVTLNPADGGGYTGTMDIPMQGMTGIAIGLELLQARQQRLGVSSPSRPMGGFRPRRRMKKW